VHNAPVLLYLHGGGYGLGSIDTHRDLIARLSWAVPGEVLAIDYRLAPEHQFPAQLEDSVKAFRFLLAQGVAPTRIVIAGDSAGGGLALATLIYLRDGGEPLPAAAVCLSPWVDLENTGESMNENERFDYISRRAVNQYAKRFVASEHLKNPLVSPLHGNLRGLPPLLVQAGGAEALLDDARRLADCADREGVDVTLEIYEDMMHVWQLFAFLLPKGRDAIESIGRFAWRHTSGKNGAPVSLEGVS
jgi:acetyl esterase/lipase